MLTQLKINSVPFLCALFIMQFLEKRLCSLSQELYISKFELPFWVISILKKHLHRKFKQFISALCHGLTLVKSLKQKQKMMLLMGTSHKYFKQRILVTNSFFYQIDFSVLLLEVCFQLLSLGYIESNPFPSHTFRTCVHAELLRDHLKGFSYTAAAKPSRHWDNGCRLAQSILSMCIEKNIFFTFLGKEWKLHRIYMCQVQCRCW